MISFEHLGNVPIAGRLGNNMFQYAFLRSCAERNNYQYGCPTWRGDELFELKETSNRIVNGIGRPHFYMEQGDLNFKPFLLNSGDGTNFLGYFQSEKYFISKEKAFNWFTFKPNKIKDVNEKYKDVNFNDCISIHFRIGDYKHFQDVHPIQPPQYYAAALKLLNENTLFVFSDEINLVKNMLPKITGKNLIYSDNKDYEDLYLMTKCRHNIIANSSFSWWGAWLNKTENRRVICPTNWFNPNCHLRNNDIYPYNWEKL